MQIHHIAIRVADVARSVEFYRDVLGLVPIQTPSPRSHSEGPPSAWLRCGETVLMLENRLRGRGDESGSAHVLVFSGVELGGLEACEKRLVRYGIAIDDRTQNTLFFRDPDGHRVGLSDFTFP